MLRIRLVELKIEQHYHEDEMKTPVHLCIGQEAIPVGICAALGPDDVLFSNHRSHGHYLAKGGDLKAMIAEFYGRESGCSRGRGGSMHLIDRSVGLSGSSAIVGGNIPIATGAALAFKMQKKNALSVVFFGDGASEEGVLYESMNFAQLKKLPILFVCEDNLYSVFSHISSRQPRGAISMRPRAFDIPAVTVDGTDVLEVYAQAHRAVTSIRAGGGPCFLHCTAYRFRGHAGTDDPLRAQYRKPEWPEWIQKDPVTKYEAYLDGQHLLSAEQQQTLRQELTEEIEDAFCRAQASPLPDVGALADFLLAGS